MKKTPPAPEGKPRGRRRLTDAPGREALLDAAMPSFANHGFEGVSLRTIAAEADVDVSLVIHLFGSKDKLWEAAVDRLAQWMAPRVEEITERLANPELTVQQRLETFIDWFVDSRAPRPEFGLFLAQEFGNPGPRQETVTNTLIAPVYQAVKPTLEAAHEANLIHAPDPAVFFFILACAISLPLAGQSIIHRLSPQPETQLSQSIKTTLQTLLLPKH